MVEGVFVFLAAGVFSVGVESLKLVFDEGGEQVDPFEEVVDAVGEFWRQVAEIFWWFPWRDGCGGAVTNVGFVGVEFVFHAGEGGFPGRAVVGGHGLFLAGDAATGYFGPGVAQGLHDVAGVGDVGGVLFEVGGHEFFEDPVVETGEGFAFFPDGGVEGGA
ncbi:Uncharacterised protein [Dermatophilus congolensis]|uniref:Uncharacterized protein n=1 Tax=Dermatophilus congolensis TaxID=1863 RepID=A0AA46BP10_9MICO|nr:Uncharacterised protein [Dermatophilus congolensis]